jgi:protein-tyrosine phosphatase
VIDLHCHVLPGLDDGPATIADSLALCRVAFDAGTRMIVATPHVSWDYPGVDASVMSTGVIAVNAALQEASVDLEVRVGAEVRLSRAAELTDGELHGLRLGAGPYVLVELPDSSGAAGIANALHALADRGYGIVLAHPERSPALRRNPDLVEQLVEMGVLCCVTARALTGHAGREVRAFAWELLGAQLVHVIGSDAHGAVRRPPDFGPELERAGLEHSQIDYFTRAAPLAIIEGRPLRAPPAVSPGRRGRLRMLTERISPRRARLIPDA